MGQLIEMRLPGILLEKTSCTAANLDRSTTTTGRMGNSPLFLSAPTGISERKRIREQHKTE